MADVKEAGDAMVNVLLPVTSLSMTGLGGSAMIWGDVSLDGNSTLHSHLAPVSVSPKFNLVADRRQMPINVSALQYL